ncbi:hypothetical protein [Metapseudomonas resinovorans]|uniref:hypothetical protein n=1 Tax=Metapseudomonas resinovorans TaxID=53412 RepID=UPI000418183D|nr:hypothetical protein [Pseudomonas resinovorans]
MKARILKKLSKRVVELAPKLFRDAWVDSYGPHPLAEKQGTRVSHMLSVGGEYDSWSGDCNEVYAAWEWWLMSWEWFGPFSPYPEGHKWEGMPNTDGFRRTTRNLLELAANHE